MSSKSVVIGQGATLKCSFGTNTSILNVADHGMKSISKTQATIADHIGMVNIMPFCSCTRPNPVSPVPCTPAVVMNWLNADGNLKLQGIPVLQKRCFVPCTFGGIIEIEKE